MKFTYCPTCGEKLVLKEIGDEGLTAFCQKCSRPFLDLPYTCTLTLVVNESDEIALIKQSYVSQTNYVCVAGYIKTGESAEETAKREVQEEIGIIPKSVSYINSYYYEKRELLMLGFVANVMKSEFSISNEVETAEWFDLNMALTKLRDGSIAMKLLKEYIDNLEQK